VSVEPVGSGLQACADSVSGVGWDLGCPMSNARAVRYRRLALAEEDRAKADLLLKLADESDRGILCTAEWLSAQPYRKIEQPPNARDAKVRFEGDPHN